MFSRKIAVRVSLLPVGLLVLFTLTTCAGGGGGTRSPSDVADVGTIAPAAMAQSGVADANVPASIAEMQTAFQAVDGSTDPLLVDLSDSFQSIGDTLAPKGLTPTPATAALSQALRAFGAIVHRDLGADVQSQLNRIATDVHNFPHTKSMNESIDFSGDDLSSYIHLTTATASGSVSVVTTNGGDLDVDEMSNFRSGSADATLSIVAGGKNLPIGSAFKDLQLKMNAGASLTAGGAGDHGPTNVGYDYGVSAVVAISLKNADGNGGKFVMTANAKNSGTIADPSTAFDSGDFSGLAPRIAVTLDIYTDSGVKKFSKTWTDINALITDLPMGGGSD